MRKHKKGVFLLTVSFILSLLLACIPSTLITNVSADANRVDEIFSNMSLEEKVTQLLMPDFRNWKVKDGETKGFTEMNDEVEDIIDEYKFGGVILFAENVVETEQTARLTYDLQEAALKDSEGTGNSTPLLIGIDQEGGIVYRLGTGTALPGNMALGATNNEEYAKNVGQIIGRELSSLGINTDFAPSMDVNNNPRNPVIGLRSYSSDPKIVEKLGLATIEGLNEYNIAGAAKHFPGHGDTGTDSHFDVPVIDKSLEELRETELAPFQKAMDSGVDMILTGHLMLPQLDDTYPATLSKKILTDLVRDDMGYEGIVITDAMNMAALVNEYGEIDAARLAIEAGVDIALMPTILREEADIAEKLDPMIEELVEYAEENDDFMARINESVKRVLQLKEDRGILDYEENKISEEEQVANAKREVGSERNRELERKIAREAVTVVKNENQNLPFEAESGDTVLLVGAYSNEVPGMEFSINRLKDEGVIPEDVEVKTQLLRDDDLNPLDREEVKDTLTDVDYAVVISEIGTEAALNPSNWLTGVPMLYTEEAEKLGVDMSIMSISNPYDTANYPDAESIIAVYGAKGMDPTEGLRPDNAFGPNIPAGIEIIFGKDNAKGKLPVDIPELDEDYKMSSTIKYELGYGLTFEEEPTYSESVEEMKQKVEDLSENDEFADENTERTILNHLRALEHYEKQEDSGKITKHLKGLQKLLNYQKENELLSEKAYSSLYGDTEQLIEKWENN